MREWERKEISLLWCISLQCAGALQLHGREKCIQKYNASVNNPLSKAACKLHNRLCQVNLNRAISFAPVPTAHSCLSPRGIHHLDCCLKGTSHPSLSQGVTFS